MHAFLVSGIKYQVSEEVKNLAKKHRAKLLQFELQKIDDVRKLRQLVKLKFSQKTAIVIKSIDTATNEAQNAFLKNLEEPQENLIYILTASNTNNVIDTILSRCQIIQTQNPKPKTLNKLKIKITKFQKGNIDYKFEVLGKIKDRQEAIAFTTGLILVEHERKNFRDMENYLKTLKNLKSNGNVSLQLVNMLVASNSLSYNKA